MPFSLNRFKTSVERQNVMHGNRYIVDISIPRLLFNKLGSQASQASGFTYRETLTFRAEGVSFPGMMLASADGIPPRLGYGAVEGVPYNIIHDDLTITFGLDDKGIVHKFFYEWMDLIVGHKAYGQSITSLNKDGTQNEGVSKAAYEVQYKKNYSADMTIYVLGPENNEASYTKEYVMKAKVYKSFPRNMPALNLSYAEKSNYLRFPVQFNYTDFVINHKKLNGGNDITINV